MAAEANLTRIEEEMRRFWQWYGVPQALRASRAGSEPFRVLQQPIDPVGTSWCDQIRLLATADLCARYRSQRGRDAAHFCGWSLHGLPLELIAEHRTSPSFGGVGLATFTAACRELAVQSLRQGELWAERLAVWLTPEATYTTLEPAVVGAVWSVLRRLWDVGRLRHIMGIVPVCPQCATPLSFAEAAANTRIADATAVWVRLPWEGEPESYFLACSEVPWTLIGMVGLAAHPDAEYVLAECSERPEDAPARVVISANALESAWAHSCRVLRRIPARTLRGARYRPLFTFLPEGQGSGRVHLSTEVPLDSGTGLMPITPAFEARSLALARTQQLAVQQSVDDRGRLSEQVTPWRGRSPWDIEPLLVEDLLARGLVHQVQHVNRVEQRCPYCASRLLPLVRATWQVESDAGPWIVGRDRAWSVPLPIWSCESCGQESCVAGLDDLAHRTGTDVERIDPFRPAVDRLSFACPACSGSMRRVSPVLDAHWLAAVVPVVFAPHSLPSNVAVTLEASAGWLAASNDAAALTSSTRAAECALALSRVPEGAEWDPSRVVPSDALRWATYSGTLPGDAERVFLQPLWQLCMALLHVEPAAQEPVLHDFLERWLRARLYRAALGIAEALEANSPSRGARELAALVEAVAGTYVPFGPGGEVEAARTLCRLAAPFVPHVAEAIYREAGARAGDSVHVAGWPDVDPMWENSALLDQMAVLQRLERLSREAREQAGVLPDRCLRRAVAGPLRNIPVETEWTRLEPLVARMLCTTSVEFWPGLPAAVSWRLSLRRERAVNRAVPFDDIQAALAGAQSDEAAGLAEPLHHGFSASLSVGPSTITLLPEEVQVEVEARPGWIAAGAPDLVVALEVGS